MTVARHTPASHLPAHHFPEDMLLDYAAGSLPEGLSILVAVHLSLCPACRAAVADGEAIGGALLAQIDPVALAPDALDRVLARLDAEEAVAGMTAAAQGALPPPLGDYLGGNLDKLDWQPLAPNVEQVALRPRTGTGTAQGRWPGTTEVALVRMAPGAIAPRHRHEGIEATVMVQGGFADEFGQYERGDAWIVGSTIEHGPVALPGEPCLCLVYLDAPLKPAGNHHVASI